MYSILHGDEIINTSDLNEISLPYLASPNTKSEYGESNLSLKVRCETNYLCWFSVLLESVHSFDSDVPYSFDESRGGPDGSGGKYIMVASICKYVGVLIVRLILQN